MSFLQTLTKLQTLYLTGTQVSGSLSFLQTLTQLQTLNLSNTQVSGSITSLQQLTSLSEMSVAGSQVGVPTEHELAVFTEQHLIDCYLEHDE